MRLSAIWMVIFQRFTPLYSSSPVVKQQQDDGIFSKVSLINFGSPDDYQIMG